ncbi:MAG: AraC family transcriptional regulator [Pseudomonadales bacterium]|nr:AraC family transcriptional regulator [Pseudomonadales bacterium]
MANLDHIRFPTTLFQCVDSYLSMGFAHGYNLEDFLTVIGMSEEDFRDANQALNYQQCTNVLSFLTQTSTKLPPALQALSVLSINNMGIGGIAGLTASNLGDALQLTLDYHKLVAPVVDIELKKSATHYHLSAKMNTDMGVYNDLVLEMIVGGLKQFTEEVTGKKLDINVALAHTPMWHTSEDATLEIYEDFFNCKVKFNSPETCLSANIETIDECRVKSSNRILHNFSMDILKKIADSEDAKLTIAEKAKRILKKAAENDIYLDLEELSNQLNMSPRTLSRKLERDNVQFKELSNEIRFNRAKYLLKDSEAPLKSIASKVGYSNADAFVRAFKTYTGDTPSQWKSKQQLAEPSSFN